MDLINYLSFKSVKLLDYLVYYNIQMRKEGVMNDTDDEFQKADMILAEA